MGFPEGPSLRLFDRKSDSEGPELVCKMQTRRASARLEGCIGERPSGVRRWERWGDRTAPPISPIALRVAPPQTNGVGCAVCALPIGREGNEEMKRGRGMWRTDTCGRDPMLSFVAHSSKSSAVNIRESAKESLRARSSGEFETGQETVRSPRTACCPVRETSQLGSSSRPGPRTQPHCFARGGPQPFESGRQGHPDLSRLREIATEAKAPCQGDGGKQAWMEARPPQGGCHRAAASPHGFQAQQVCIRAVVRPSWLPQS